MPGRYPPGGGSIEGIFGMKDDKQTADIIMLEDSLESLKERFNSDRGKIRFLALLSPTCPM